MRFLRTPIALALAVIGVCVSTPVLAAAPVASAASMVSAHPLDPLTSAEIVRAAALMKGYMEFPSDGIFALIDLKEPSKEEVAAWHPGVTPARRAKMVVLSRKKNRSYEGDVDLRSGKVLRWTGLSDVQPMVIMEEYDIAAKAVKNDGRWQAAIRKRGITDFGKVGVDGWAAGPALGSGRRVMRALSFYRGDNKNYYNRPIEGISAVVDLNSKQVLEVTDTGVVPLAPKGYDFDSKSTKGNRKAPNPMTVSMPMGHTFQVNGNEVRWQNWRFRFSIHARDGLVLHQVGYEDHGKLRPILYRAALSEMIVPYGDPDPNWNWRAAFDVGEYGFGNLGSPLDKGGDVPATAQLFDAVFADSNGKPFDFPRAIGLYERDGGVLWKHYDYVSGVNNVRRGRQLVLTTSATIGNYDYLINWIFHQDGTLEMDAGATGILLGKGSGLDREEKGTCPGCNSHLTDHHILAPNHQHFFNFRLDFDVDGTRNALLEMNQKAMEEGPHNPNGNAFTMGETLLARESEAQRDLAPDSNRRWRVINPSVRNALGNYSGYMLLPGDSTPAYVTRNSSTRNRATFLDHAVWGTRFKATEVYAAGDYPNQAVKDTGLSRWANDNDSINNEDLVLWYTMGLSHAPREEEWPMMNTHHLGFKIMPSGFFSSNPALDVPK